MKISEIITDKYKLRIPPTVYYDLLADVREAEEEQEPKAGHWLGDSYGYICSNCEHSLNDLAQSMDYISFSKPKYCPNCGCRMVEPQESEET